MKLLPLLAILAVAASSLAAGCKSNGSNTHDHWTTNGLSPRMGRAMLAYDEERDGSWETFQKKCSQDRQTLMNRYFFNYNPDNPFQGPK